jgi:hypothetical protein
MVTGGACSTREIGFLRVRCLSNMPYPNIRNAMYPETRKNRMVAIIVIESPA